MMVVRRMDSRNFPLLSDDILFSRAKMVRRRPLPVQEQMHQTNELLNQLMEQSKQIDEVNQIHFKITGAKCSLVTGNYQAWSLEHFQYIQDHMTKKNPDTTDKKTKIITQYYIYRAIEQFSKRVKMDRDYILMETKHKYNHTRMIKGKGIILTNEERKQLGMFARTQ